MTKITVFSSKGTKAKEIEPAFAKADVNQQALAQAVRVYTDHTHPSLSKVKTRGMVNISTRKIYRQKGTGNARHGAKSAPIFVGGGSAHGPKGLKRVVSLSKSIKKTALVSALAIKAKEKGVVVVDGLGKLKKASEASKLFNLVKKDLGRNSTSRVTVVLSESGNNLAFRNIYNTFVYPVNSLNALRVVNGGIIMFDQDSLNYFESKKKEKPVVKSETKEAAAKKEVKKELPKKVTIKKLTKAKGGTK